MIGKLKYKDGYWVGHAPLARFAAVPTRAPEQPLSEADAEKMIADMNTALDGMKDALSQRLGPAAGEVFANWDKEVTDEEVRALDAADESDPREEERERRRMAKSARKAARLAKGQYPVRLTDPDEAGPSPEQEAAVRHLMENEPAVLEAVLAAVFAAFRHAYDDEYWRSIAGIRPAASAAELRGRFGLDRVVVAREHRGGLAHLMFEVDADWQDEHGLVVVYSPDIRQANWTTWDGLEDLLESDDPAHRAEDYVPTQHDELVEAILAGDESRAKELVAAGADINALAPDEYPPLCMAVDQMEVEEVRRLLAYGADPNKVDPDEKKTPLRMAKRLYRDMGFGSTRKNDPLFGAVMEIARQAAGKQFDDMKNRLEQIIHLLESAGGK